MENKSNVKIKIAPIRDLLGKNFYIANYQRGYRWGKQEVKELLDDIFDYYKSSKDSNSGEFYCLQPIVVRGKEWKNSLGKIVNGYELIDGQQRLTTIFLILSYLRDIRLFFDQKDVIFNMSYQTREECEKFFRTNSFTDANAEISSSNADFYHITQAYSYIEKWFIDKAEKRLDILKTILEDKKNVSIIWYEITDENISALNLFSRLNKGRIPLTDAELIKALLLQSDKYIVSEKDLIKFRLHEIASEWDKIESTLQDNKVWYMINDTSYTPSSRIELIFKILAKRWNIKHKYVDNEKQKHYEYLVFESYLQNKRNGCYDIKHVDEIWQDVKDIFVMIMKFYNDHLYYHYIGYIIAKGGYNIEDLIFQAKTSVTEGDFLAILRGKIRETVKIKARIKDANVRRYKMLSELYYGSDDSDIGNILLLFNVDALIKCSKENARFPFHLYKEQKISSIEHIHPQNPKEITDKSNRMLWLSYHLELLKKTEADESLIDGISNLLVQSTDDISNDDFALVQKNIDEYYMRRSGMLDSEKHTLYNLALVDKDTNSKLNNSHFDEKREILKSVSDKYIPICTQKVFSKYYSSSPKDMIFWGEEDRARYFEQIEQMYNKYQTI